MSRTRQSHLSEEDVDELRRLYRDRIPARTAAKKLDCTERTVHKHYAAFKSGEGISKERVLKAAGIVPSSRPITLPHLKFMEDA